MKQKGLLPFLCALLLLTAAGAEFHDLPTAGGFIQDAAVDSTPATTVFTFKVNDSLTPSDVRLRFSPTHQFVSDIQVILAAPDGTTVTLVEQVGNSVGLIDIDTYFGELVFRDDAPGAISPDSGDWTSEVNPQIAAPPQVLSALLGSNSQGTWELRRFVDYSFERIGYVDAGGEELRSFELEVGIINPEAAVQWAATVDEPERREKTIVAAACHWLASDEMGATRRLDASDFPKETLLAIRESSETTSASVQ